MSRPIPFKEKMKAKRAAEKAEREAAEQARIQKEKEIFLEECNLEGLAQVEQEYNIAAQEAEKIDRGLDDTLAEIERNKKIRVEEQIRAAEMASGLEKIQRLSLLVAFSDHFLSKRSINPVP